MAEAALETVPLTTTAPAENVEITPRPTQGAWMDEIVVVFGLPFAKLHAVFALLAIVSFVVGSVCFGCYASGDKNPNYIPWIIGSLFFFIFFIGAIATSRRDILPRSREARVTQNDVEGQVPTEPEASEELLPGPSGCSQLPPSLPSFSGSSAEPHSETSSSCGIASEKRSPLTSDSDEEPSNVSTISDVASSFIEIAKGASAADKKEATTAEAAKDVNEATSTVERQVVGGTSEPGQNRESELTSSGEVRRRNISGQSSVESKRSSEEVQQSSSDEENKQE